MKPVICFFEDEKYLYSREYTILQCGTNQSVMDFLKSIEENYFAALKIVQINFEFDESVKYDRQTELYKAAKASVFILKSFEIKSRTEVLEALQPKPITEASEFTPLVTKEQFIEKTKYVLQQIAAGRIYQANLTAPLRALCKNRPNDVFGHFENKFSGAYKALLPLPDFDLHCFSPELFLQQKDGVLITRPIKGSLGEGEDFTQRLYDNQKEAAELSMIVDLLRNDLNSLSAEHGSVVNTHRQQLQLGYIQHTYSEIAVRNLAPLSYVLEKTFPGGSISGCPKVESLAVIREVESYKRQAYTGSLGWWQNNEFTLNITIRTLIQTDEHLYYHAGCGIVYDSNPEAEWDEFLLKTGALSVK